MQNTDPPGKPYLLPGEVATLFGVTTATIRNWVQAGLLHATETAGGHRRFQRRDVMAFARQQGLIPSTATREVLRVLIVDDDLMVTKFLEKVLRSFPVPVITEVAHDGFDAGQMVASFHPDLVLLDLYMDDLNGFEVCDRLKKEPLTRSIRVIAITGHHTPEIEQRIMELGAETCLPKPIDKHTLFDAISKTRTTRPLRL